MLPTAVLKPPSRGGKKNKKRNEADTKSRCRAWLDGERANMWKEAVREASRSNQKGHHRKQSPERCDGLVLEHVRNGQFSKGSAALISNPPVVVTEAVVAEMKAKHPPPRQQDLDDRRHVRAVNPAAALQVDGDAVLKALNTFPKGSACGLSGLRPQHLKDAVVPGMQDEFARQLCQVVNLLLQGRAPESVRPWLCGAKLVALPKHDNTLRPIAVGETLRRLVAKLALSASECEFRDYLEPTQVGVGTRYGSESIIHVVRQYMGRHGNDGNRVVVLLDIENAFNSIDRNAIMRSVRRVNPALAAWADMCYGSQSTVLLDSVVLTSDRGVQQGDPAGPAFFSACIQEDILDARANTEQAYPGKIDWVAFYLDDGVVGGSADAVQHFVQQLSCRLARKGLSFNIGKCEVVPTAREACTFDRSMFAGMAWRGDGCFKLLGAPFGSAEHCKHVVSKRVDKAIKLLNAASEHSNVQCGLLLVRHCASFCRLAYVCRVTPPNLVAECTAAFETAIRGSVSTLIGGSMGEREWAAAGLSIREGGLGLRHPTAHASASYCASFLNCRRLCREIDHVFDGKDTFGHSSVQGEIDSFNSRVDDMHSIDIEIGDTRQKTLSHALDIAMRSRLKQDNAADPYFLGHLNLIRLPGAGAWLTDLPQVGEQEWDTNLFRISLKRRCRLRVQNEDSICPLCGSIMDSFGDHALVCPCGGDRTTRHNRLRDTAHIEMNIGHLGAEKEKQGLLPDRPADDGVRSALTDVGDERRRPADIWLPRGGGSTNGCPEALDFAVTSGLRSDLIQRVCTDPEHIFSQYAALKETYRDTGQKCRAQGFQFTPLIFESHGGSWSLAARRIFDFVAKQQQSVGEVGLQGASLKIAQRLSSTLHRENARAIFKRLAQQSPGTPQVYDLTWGDSDTEA
jgi:hypothetical protein